MAPEQAQLERRQAWASFHLAFMERLRALPGVETVGIVENFPLNEGVSRLDSRRSRRRLRTPRRRLAEPDVYRGRLLRSDGHSSYCKAGYSPTTSSAEPGLHRRLQVDGGAPLARRGSLGKRLTFNQFDLHGDRHRRRRGHPAEPLRRRGGPNVYFPLVSQNPEIWAMSTPAYVLKTARADEHRARGARPGSRSRTRSADVSHLYDRRARRAFHGRSSRSR